jgi:hypothetical protein
VRVALLAVVAAACTSHATPNNRKPVDAGISIALYAKANDSYAVVDDRRWIEVTEAPSIMLANIDPGAELASLVIEPSEAVGSGALRIGQCVRERLPDAPPQGSLEEHARLQRERRAQELHRRNASALVLECERDRPQIRGRTLTCPEPPDAPTEEASERFIPVVQCDVRATPGRYLVRLVYVTKAIGYRAQHEIEIKDEARAQVTSRFAIATPSWQSQADVVLYDSVPGAEKSPRAIARGRVALDGSTSVLTLPTRDVTYQLRRVYEGGVVVTEDSSDVMWGHESVQAVWVWLELPQLRLAPGPVHVHLDVPREGVRDLDVPAGSRKLDNSDAPFDAPLRLPLWVDESLRGTRQRIVEYNDGASLQERYLFGVANTGDTEREVWVEERVRRASRRRLERAWPRKPTVEREVLKTKLAIKPGRFERTGYTLTYDF